MEKIVHVAVGVIEDGDGKICIALRPKGKHLEGYWEFPGGKVESGESVQSALARELLEELSIAIESTQPLIEIKHQYPTKTVFLDVHVVNKFTGNASGKEGQEVRWVKKSELTQFQFPDANKEIINAILQAS